MKENIIKTPWHLYLIGTVFTITYLIGLYDFTMIHSNNLSYINALEVDGDAHNYFSTYPLILSIFWAVNIVGGLIAAIMLFFKNKWTVWISLLSVISLVILDIITFIFRNRWEVFGPQISISDLIVLILSVAFFWYCRTMTKHEILA